MPTPINWPGATYGSGTGTPYESPNGDVWIWTGYSWEGLIATATLSAGTTYTKELISGGASWNSGMTFDVSDLTYTFYGPIQTADEVQVTLSNGDATYDRIDAIVVSDDDPNGVISVKEGVPAPNPTTPEISSDQLLVQYVIVPAGVTSMPISQLVIYDNDTEWTGSVVDFGGSGTFTFNSATPTPFNSSVCLNVTGNNRRRWARFSEPNASSVTASDYALFSFRVYFPSDIITSRTLTVRFRSSGAYVGNSVNVTPTFASRTVTGQWQNVVIPLSLFAIPLNFDAVDIQLSGSITLNSADWSIDLVQLQDGISPAIGPNPTPNRWGIYGQGTGVLTTYNTFAQALSSSVSYDTIHLFGSVTETINTPYNISGRSINLNGHIWSLKGTIDVGSVLNINRDVSIYNGTIINISTSSLITSGGGIIRVNGNAFFDGLKVWNRGDGHAIVFDNSEVQGGYFLSYNDHAGYVDVPGDGTKLRDMEFVTYAEDCYGFYSFNGDNDEYNNIKGYSYNQVGCGSGIYLNGGGGLMLNSYGYTISDASGATESCGIKVNGKWELKGSIGINDAPDGGDRVGLWITGTSTSCIGKGSIGVQLEGGGGHKNLIAEGQIKGLFFSSGGYIGQSCISGSCSVYATEEASVQIDNSTLEGLVLGETGSCFIVANSSIDGRLEVDPTILLGPSGGSTEVTKFINCVINSRGADYSIDALGATARDIGNIN
jgi:hypothetical protein